MKTLTHVLSTMWSNREFRRKLIFTLAVFFVYRLLAHIPVPAVDRSQLSALVSDSALLSYLNIFAGGTLANFSIVAVGINPYITASIVMQLATLVFPALKEMQKDGESGRERMNQYTRFLTVPLAVIQSVSVLALMNTQALLTTSEPMVLVSIILTLVAGAMILMWLGELVTIYGLGNGISLLMLAGIISQFPVAIAQTMIGVTSQQWGVLATFAVVFLGVIGLIVFMTEAVRKVNIQYAKRQRGSRVYGGQVTHLPIRVNVAGVMPIIFAVSLMLVPSLVASLLIKTNRPDMIAWGQQLSIWFAETSPVYMAVYFAIVFTFTYLSALIFFNAEDIAEELKKSGAFVPGIRPGSPTKRFLQYVVTRITFAGAVFLGFIALMPSIAQNLTGLGSLAVGGTSVLIVVSVILETAKQVQSMFVGENYEQYT